MEEVILKLKQAADIKSSIAKQEAKMWQKVSEAITCFLKSNVSKATKQVTKADNKPEVRQPNKMYLDTVEAAEFLAVSKKTLECWRWKGNDPKFSKVGRLARYKQKDLEEFLEKNSFSHTSAYPR